MKITAVSNTSYDSLSLKNRNNSVNISKKKEKTDNTSFRGIFLEKDVRLGDVSVKNYPPVLLPKDALLLNEIAAKYPNQDCFIRKGYGGFPRLEYREKPPELSIFSENSAKYYESEIAPDDKKYPSIPLIIHKNSVLNRFIGMTSDISFNPSLPYTVKAGYEVHKKILEKKFQILDVVGDNEEIDFGEQSLMEKAYESIEDVEVAVTRYLLECSYSALTNKDSAKQLYTSIFSKVQSRLKAKRRIDLTTSTAKQPLIDKDDVTNQRKDICETAMEKYPNTEENKKRIKELSRYMLTHGITLG